MDNTPLTSKAIGPVSAFKMDLLGVVLVNLLIHCSANIETSKSFDNGWIPLINLDKTTQIDLNSIRTIQENTWKEAEPMYEFDATKPDAIRIVTPAQPEIINGSTYFNVQNVIDQDLQSDIKETTKLFDFDTRIEGRESKDIKVLKNSPHRHIFDKTNISDVNFEHNTETFQRTSKEIRNHNFVNEIRNLYENVIKERTEATRTTDKDSNQNEYEVTEPTNEEESNDSFKLGYVYKHPIVVPVGLTTARNEFSARLQDNLKKYNIKSDDMLNNYAISKSYVNNYDSMFQMYRSHLPAVVAIPFRYNRLNHLPVNPLLGVLLSNYGYYVQGTNGLPNYYRNFYGFAAPKIISNRVTSSVPSERSYRMLSDTDSFN